MKRDDDQELWDLLGQAPESKVSPFFARNVLREIREPSDWATLRGWLNPRRLVPALGAATALVAVVFMRMQTSIAPLAAPSDTLASIDAQDYEVIADLDDLLASDDNNSLDESVLL
ncbi:MAG: hypothetical protein DMF06_15835 [Verrucomicrobia bacterium]|nr:MAG: hypothetical protein DMF06_15835 [Verrucomicrobiota bacterium]